ncbi:hypothetical protein GCM10022234_00440 [Aeromicrobium panaciterrae]
MRASDHDPADFGGVTPPDKGEVQRLVDRLWVAFGCAPNPDSFKATQRESMVARMCEWAAKAERDAAADIPDKSAAIQPVVESVVCGCPRNEVGDISCNRCGEKVNIQCWNCRTMRGDGVCPNPVTASERFAASLSAGPLTQHLRSIHALLLHLGAAGDALTLGEHSLREIATYTMHSPYERRR